MKTLLITLALLFGGMAVKAQTVFPVASGNWSNPAIWNTASVPGQNDNVNIASGINITIDTSAYCNNLTIASGATLNGDSAMILGISGNWNNCGMFNHNKGIVTFNGTTQQIITGNNSTEFYSLELNNASGLNLNRNIDIKHNLTLTQGTLDVSSFKLTLLSDSVETAYISPINSGADINGKISVQRYMSSGATGWRFLGSPVKTTLQDWNDDFVTSGFPGSAYPSFNFCSIYTYNETDTGSCVNGYVMPTNVTDSIMPGTGYWCWVGPTPTTVEVTGYPAKFTQNFNVSLTPSGGKYNDGWNMIANPYPCAIDWDSPNWTKTGIQDAVYIWDPVTEQYSTYINGIGVNGGTNIIPSSRSFWVQAVQNSPVLNCNEQIKTTSDASFLRPASTSHLRLKLSGNGYNDETVVLFSAGSSASVNPAEDAIKLYSDNPLVPSINSVHDSLDLAVNRLPVANSTVIPIKVKVGVSGTYTLELSQAYSLFPSACIFIEDRATSSLINARNAFTYTFNINDTTSAPRFLLHFTKPIQKAAFGASCSYKNDGMAIVTTSVNGVMSYTWKDGIGNILGIHNASQQDTLKNLAGGLYLVKMQLNLNYCTSVEEQIVVPSPGAIQPIVKNISNLCFKGHSGSLSVTGVNGGTAPFGYVWSTGNTSGILQNLAEGTYSLIVTDANGCRDTTWHAVNTVSPLKTFFACDSVVNVNDPVVFTNNTFNALSYAWDFGDTTYSNAVNPVHFYIQPGTHTITLTANDNLCTGSYQKIITVVNVAGIAPQQAPPDEVIIAAGNNGAVITFNLHSPAPASISVYSSDGKLLSQQRVTAWKNSEPVKIEQVQGVYVIRVEATGKETVKKIII